MVKDMLMYIHIKGVCRPTRVSRSLYKSHDPKK